ncbi:MAG TPA: helix-turn-helix transcriptional regulator [Amycolatopsis sp.]|uniref:helix-turn-helix domain-containing protein n=1 Tax=Amycolatopsis sp. TaxID=37632 RepID=UPI002B49C2D5|nr:helix-turn-helix transcriptional regulator [Amycolatopsis sp.]HKS46721.1 helix-turn-helix transcriptional regulator [Amycolatopsis sp.]
MAHEKPSYELDGNGLRNLRVRAGFRSTRAFAAACKTTGGGPSSSQISNYENGKQQPRTAALFTMAGVLSVALGESISPGDLLKQSGTPEEVTV